MDMKKTKKRADFYTLVAIVIGIMVALNYLSYQLFARIDLTSNKDYSISPASKDLVRNLDDIVNIKMYFSKELPGQLASVRQEVADVLDEYRAYSGGKISVESIDPADDPELQKKLYSLGIQEAQFQTFEKDKMQIQKGYLAIVIQFGDKTEVLPVVQNTENLEYQLTLAIRKVSSGETVRIGFLSSNGTMAEGEMSNLRKKLAEIFEVVAVDLNQEDVPSDIVSLVIAGPKEKFSENQLKAIDAYLMQGRSVLAFVDGVKLGEGLTASVNDTGLDKMIEKYGVKIDKNLVLDVNSGLAPFSQGFFTFTINYPFWPKIVKSGFDQQNSAVAKLESVVLPWASSLGILSDKIDSSAKITYLAKSSVKSWTQENNFNLNPQITGVTGEQKSRNMAIAISGKFTSAYGQGSTDNGKLIIVGDSDFLNDRISQDSDNLIFAQNLIDSASLDEALINIRSKGITQRPIKGISDGAKIAVRYLNVFGVTALVLAFGLFRYFSRRKSKFVDEL